MLPGAALTEGNGTRFSKSINTNDENLGRDAAFL